ncbi:hypothetical protein D3C76_1164980 [compost metagenome]
MHAIGIDLHRRRIGLRIRLVDIDPRTGTEVITLAQQLPVTVLGLPGGLRQVEQMLVGLEAQPGAGDFTDQRQPRRLVIRLGRFEPRPGGIALAADTPEQVQLVGGKTRRCLIRIGDAASGIAAPRRAHQWR